MLQIGDPVKWVVQRDKGRTIQMKQLEGTLLAIDDEVATVKLKNGHKHRLRLEILRHATNEPGLLTEFLHALAKAEPTA